MPSNWVRWLCLALVALLWFGPGGLERAHVGVSHDHFRPTSHDGPAGTTGTEQSGNTHSGSEMVASCETCRELQWARLSQTGTGSPIRCWDPVAIAVERFMPIVDQVRSVAVPAQIRSRAPPTG